MRRLLQLSTLVLILTVCLTPISEALDHWDPPGLNNDTEFALFAVVFCIALVLLVCQLTAMSREVTPPVSFPVTYPRYKNHLPANTPFLTTQLCTGPSPPLRI